MNLNKTFFIALLVLLFGIQQQLASQFDKLFLNKPDKDIKEVVCYEVINNDSSVFSKITFNKQGLITSENQPDFHIHINYKYDKDGRISEKESLFGESFANGTTNYEYKNKTTIAEINAMGYYSLEIDRYNNLGAIDFKEIYFISAGMGDSKVERQYFYYDKSGKHLKTMFLTEYFDINKEAGSLIDIKNKNDLIKELLVAPLKRMEQGMEIYKYNKKGQLYRQKYTDLKTNISNWERTYLLNLEGLVGVETYFIWNSENMEKTLSNQKYTKSFLYNNNKELVKVVEDDKVEEFTKYYDKGRLIKKTESRNQGESVTNYHFYYTYYK